MAKTAPIQDSFSVGELSPDMYGHATAQEYKQAVAVAENCIPLAQGPLVRRPGTKYVESSTSTTGRLEAVKFAQTESYIFWFRDSVLKIYHDGSLVATVVTPYLAADIPDLCVVPIPGVIKQVYIYHSSYQPRALVKAVTGHTSWTLSAIQLFDGPWIQQSQDTIPVTYYTLSGYYSGRYPALNKTTVGAQKFFEAVSATGDPTLGINNGAGFSSADIGRKLRVKEYKAADSASYWVIWTIKAIVSTAKVEVYNSVGTGIDPDTGYFGTPGDNGGYYIWYLDLYNSRNGWPASACIHESRLAMFGRVPGFTNRVDVSYSGQYSQFSPSILRLGDTNGTAGSVTDDCAMALTFNARDKVAWVGSVDKALFVGTESAEKLIYSSDGGALTPTTVAAKDVTEFGSSQFVPPVNIGQNLFFLQLGYGKLRELNFEDAMQQYLAPDRTLLSNHILSDQGVKQMAFSKKPYPVLWCVLRNGNLATMTYERSQNGLSVGWARQILGAPISESEGVTAAEIQSVAVVPVTESSPTLSASNTWNQVYLLVGRTIGGVQKTYLERVDCFFAEEADEKDAFFVDCGLNGYSLNPYYAVLDATDGGATATITSLSHGFSVGDRIRIKSTITAVRAAIIPSAFDLDYTVTAVPTVDTFVVTQRSDFTIPTCSGSFGTAWRYVDTISGLSHLEGLTVRIRADGTERNPQVVTGGSVTVSGTKATIFHAGLGFKSRGRALPIESGSANGTAIGKTRRTHRVGLMLHRTGPISLGPDFDNMSPVPLRVTTDPLNQAPIFSGIISESIECDYDFENKVCWEQDNSAPGKILAFFPQLEVQDRL